MSTDQFFLNASLGCNQWWRWALGLITILFMWIGIGTLVLVNTVCYFLSKTNVLGLTCLDNNVLTGLVSSGFIIGLIGVWMVVKLIHRKDFRKVITGRASFDYKRYINAMLAALLISLVMFVAKRLILQLDITFQEPKLGVSACPSVCDHPCAYSDRL